MEALDLKSKLIPAPPIIGPLNLHEIPGLILPPEHSALQHQLADLVVFTDENKMKINNKKTKIMPFNFCKKYDFLPLLHFPGCGPLEVIYETRLLGITITSNLTWSAHVNDITTRATRKLWVLVRFKAMGGTTDQLVTVYQSRIRTTLEFGAPVFNSSLTRDQINRIEMVQKKVCAIIIGRNYEKYESALKTLGLECLDTRRTTLCLNFALRCSKSKKHMSMFPKNPSYRENMRKARPFKERQCSSSRYFNSPLPYLIRLLNKNHKQ